MTSPSMLAPGAVFARDYTVVRPLSEGGMGAVYVVQQTSTGMQRALKLMHPELVRDLKLRQRFEQEARVGARIESEHVVQVLGAGVDEPSGMPWLVMELLHGEDLAGLIGRRGAIPPAEVRDLFAQFTHAIAAAHRVGVVHRDLKPENIFVARSHREGATHLVKVLDFGIAKIVAEARSTATQAIGTPIWMAPEQTEPGRSIQPTADVWPLGLIAFRLLTGKHFWISANSEEATSTMVLREVVFDPIVSASARAAEYGVAHLLPPGFDAWFGRCVVRDLAARFPSAEITREAFFEMMGRASSVPAAPPAPPLANTAPVARAFTSAPAYTPAPAFTPVPAFTPPSPATPYLPPGPQLPPPPPPRKAPSGGARWPIAAALGLVAVAGVGLGVRAYGRSQQVEICASGKPGEGEDLLAACRTACDVEPKKYCVTHGDLARSALTAASREAASGSYDKACAAGDLRGCVKLGALWEIEHKDEAALASFQKACDGADAAGCARLGARIERGRGLARDPAKARGYYEAACDGEDPASCALLAFARDNLPVPRPDTAETDALVAKAVPALERECQSGGLSECLWLGAILERRADDPSGKPARDLYHRACSGGLAEACNNEAISGLPGAGPALAEALRGGCSGGVLSACNNLAVIQSGVGFVRRQEQGTSQLVVACDALTLGCTERGKPVPPPADVPRDRPGALAALEKACSLGSGVACANLGALHESGLSVPRDPVKALSLYEKACTAGASLGCGTMRESPFRGGEVWSGSYVCPQGPTHLDLRILDGSTDQRVTAIFDLDFGQGKTRGRFLLSGAYDPAQGSIVLTPGIWLEQPPGWMTVGMRGQVSLHKNIFHGRIEGAPCGAFRVVRQTSDMVEPRCAAGAHFVEGHGCVPAPRSGPTLVGSWSGRGSESSGQSWPLTAAIKSLESGRCGQVTYPSLSCGGDWYCVASSDGKRLRVREIITSGQSRCDSTGFVDLTLSDDGQAADFRWSSPIRTVVSTARLARSAP